MEGGPGVITGLTWTMLSTGARGPAMWWPWTFRQWLHYQVCYRSRGISLR